jgi:glycosyltransferase involved in cell wall biosynthesis
MRILMVAPSYSIHAVRPLQQLLDRGIHVTFADSENPLPQERRENYRFVRFPSLRGKRVLCKMFGNAFPTKLEEIWLRNFVRRTLQGLKPDLIHLHWLDDRAHSFIGAFDTPIVISIWGTDLNQHFFPNADPFFKQRAGEVLAHSHTIVVDAPEMDRKCEALSGKGGRFANIHLGFPTEHFAAERCHESAQKWRQSLEIQDDEKVVFSPRAWRRHYAHHEILEAFAMVHKKEHANLRLIFKLYNNDDNNRDYENEVRARARALDVEDRIIWLGDLSPQDLASVYYLSDLTVNCPRTDTLPIMVMEAAASKKPVLSYELPTYRGTFAEDFCYFVPHGDVKGLSREMSRILFDTEPDPNRLETARKHVLEHFDEKLYVVRILDLYRSITLSCVRRDLPR